MSVRSNNVRYNSSLNSSSTTPIDFKEEFSNSAAALAASHDETVSHILSRLDQLQSKISNQPENSTTPPQQQLAASAVKTISTAARKTDGDLNSRLQSLENIHENVLQRLNGKLDSLERRLSENKEAEKLMGQIATKFGHVEARLKENKDAEKLMSQIASKFSHIEAKLQSASRLQERVSDLESRIARTHAPDLQKRVARLEAQGRFGAGLGRRAPLRRGLGAQGRFGAAFERRAASARAWSAGPRSSDSRQVQGKERRRA